MPVSDHDKAKAFYVDVLGFELVSDTQMSPDMRWVMVGPRGGQSAITLVTWFDSMPAGSLKGKVLESDDLDADATLLAQRGVVTSGIDEEPWDRYLSFDDPDGNRIVLQSTCAGPLGGDRPSRCAGNCSTGGELDRSRSLQWRRCG